MCPRTYLRCAPISTGPPSPGAASPTGLQILADRLEVGGASRPRNSAELLHDQGGTWNPHGF